MKEVNIKKSVVHFNIFFGMVTALKTVRKGILVEQTFQDGKHFVSFRGFFNLVKAF